MVWRAIGVVVLGVYGLFAVVAGFGNIFIGNNPLMGVLALLFGAGLLYAAKTVAVGAKRKDEPRNNLATQYPTMRVIRPNGDRLGGTTITDAVLSGSIETIYNVFRTQLYSECHPFKVFQFDEVASMSAPVGLWAEVSFNHQLFVWMSVGRSGSTLEWSLYGADLRNGLWQGVKSSYFFLKKDNPFVTGAPPGAWTEVFNVLRVLGFDPSGAKDSLAHSGPQSISYAGLDMAERLRERVESLWMASLRQAAEEPQQTAPIVAPPVIDGYEPKPTIKRRRE